MFSRRFEKLERLQPPGTSDLMNRWERQAMTALTSEDQALVRACVAKGCHCKRPDTEAEIAAMRGYEKALADKIQDVSDAELDSIMERLGGAAIVAAVTA